MDHTGGGRWPKIYWIGPGSKTDGLHTKKEFLNLRLPLETESDLPYYVTKQFQEIIIKLENRGLDQKIKDYYKYTQIEDITDGYDKYKKEIENKCPRLEKFLKTYMNEPKTYLQ